MLCEIIVEKNCDVKKVIEDFVLAKGWQSAYISGAIGSVKDMQFLTPINDQLPPQIEVTPCYGPGEILAFTGEVMKRELMDPNLSAFYKDEGPLFIHIHASVATAGGHVYGGGFKQGKAFRSLKIYIQDLN